MNSDGESEAAAAPDGTWICTRCREENGNHRNWCIGCTQDKVGPPAQVAPCMPAEALRSPLPAVSPRAARTRRRAADRGCGWLL